ncbi:MAG: alpha/beta fold hydrolase [Aeromicrobium sp.]
MIDDWWAAGERTTLTLDGTERRVFVNRMGSGSPMTLLHGFPSCSHDWAKVAPSLSASHSLLMPDFLGFGASDKPSDHVYSIHEQADLVEAVWARSGVTSTRLVAHDYGVSVGQELLARRLDGNLSVDLERVDFLNGGLYPHLHRPEPVQTALLDPVQGPAISEMINEELIVGSLAPTFAPGRDWAQDAADIWASMSRDDGYLNAHLLIRYITDRQEHADRWIGALEGTDVPLRFIWGLLDPISGAHMAEQIAARVPTAPLLALDDVAHWPPLEAPERVAGALLA